jgi:hypothetical protein
MFAIKLKGADIWAGKKNVTYFIRDDADFNIRGAQVSQVEPFGVPAKRRRIYNSAEEIRRALATVSKETVLLPPNACISFLASGTSPGSFSLYEVHDLANGTVHSLEDVFGKAI